MIVVVDLKLIQMIKSIESCWFSTSDLNNGSLVSNDSNSFDPFWIKLITIKSIEKSESIESVLKDPF